VNIFSSFLFLLSFTTLSKLTFPSHSVYFRKAELTSCFLPILRSQRYRISLRSLRNLSIARSLASFSTHVLDVEFWDDRRRRTLSFRFSPASFFLAYASLFLHFPRLDSTYLPSLPIHTFPSWLTEGANRRNHRRGQQSHIHFLTIRMQAHTIIPSALLLSTKATRSTNRSSERSRGARPFPFPPRRRARLKLCYSDDLSKKGEESKKDKKFGLRYRNDDRGEEEERRSGRG